MGSTSIIVDTYTGGGVPRVVQRQYHKPYGEVAYQSMGVASSLTSIGYTGQRLDQDSGLMFYNARFYDPALSYFVSADNIAPDKGDPKTRNRYSYVLNSPLMYTDPSGHCVDREKNDPDYASGETCAGTQAQLQRYGIQIAEMDDWSLEELLAILGALKRMMSRLGWTTIAEFRYAMGIDGGRGRKSLGDIWLVRFKGPFPSGPEGSYQRPVPGGRYESATDQEWNQTLGRRVIRITYEEEILDPDELGALIVHELAHAWDHASGGCEGPYERPPCNMSRGLDKETKGDRSGAYEDKYFPAKGYGQERSAEDWAESVAAQVYPERYRGGTPNRKSYVFLQALRVTNQVKYGNYYPPK